jgi:hypothetical protein
MGRMAHRLRSIVLARNVPNGTRGRNERRSPFSGASTSERRYQPPHRGHGRPDRAWFGDLGHERYVEGGSGR